MKLTIACWSTHSITSMCKVSSLATSFCPLGNLLENFFPKKKDKDTEIQERLSDLFKVILLILSPDQPYFALSQTSPHLAFV